MQVYEEWNSVPMHDWPNNALMRLVHEMGRDSSTEVQERPLRNRAIQLLQERGVGVARGAGFTIFTED